MIVNNAMTKEQVLANIKRLLDMFDPAEAESYAYIAAEFMADLLTANGVLTGDDAEEPHFSLIGRDE